MTPHVTLGFTPHELMFGRKPNIPGILQRETPDIQYTYDSYLKELPSWLQSSYELAKNSLLARKEKNKVQHDKTVNIPLFALGDKVLLHDECIRSGRLLKLSPPRIRLHEIVDINDINVTLKFAKK
jgi:hypothetical protein